MTEERAAAAWAQLEAWLIDLSKIIVAVGIVGGALLAGTRYAHSADGPTECIVASQRPLIVESGRLHFNPPPETRSDLTQYPGALTLSFAPSPSTRPPSCRSGSVHGT